MHIVYEFFMQLAVTISGMIVYQQAAELYPTPLRSSGMSISATISSTVGIVIPYVVMFDDYGIWFPVSQCNLTMGNTNAIL